jgi:hypothetical protein
MINDDGDIIKACGYLAIYSGNLEGELDDLYELAKSYFPELAAQEHLRFTEKARHLRKALLQASKYAPRYRQQEEEKRRIDGILKHCKVVAEDRNAILHSSIYNDQRRDMIKNKRKGSRPIKSAEVYKLVNEMHGMYGAIFGLKFAVVRLGDACLKRKSN